MSRVAKKSRFPKQLTRNVTQCKSLRPFVGAEIHSVLHPCPLCRLLKKMSILTLEISILVRYKTELDSIFKVRFP